MSSIRKKQDPIKVQQPRSNASHEKKSASTAADERQQLSNQGLTGPIENVSLPESMITSLRGILLDVDPDRFRDEFMSSAVPDSPAKFYEIVVSNMLARHPVLAKAEVRCSGRGLHVLIWFDEPVIFTTDPERKKWAAIVKVIQRLLPTDPDCSGITALTRPLGSINSKNGGTVKLLKKGQPVTAEDVLALFNAVRSGPFRTLAKILFGGEHIRPCPICKGDASKLDALDFVGMCYGSCGKVRAGQLFDVFLQGRRSESRERPAPASPQHEQEE